MNICFLLGGFTNNGGIGRVTSILANRFCNEENYNIFTLSFFNTNKENLYQLDKKIKQDYLFDKPVNMTKGILSGGVFKLRKYLKENGIDILIACGALYFPISVWSCKGIKTSCFCWEHSNLRIEKDHKFQMICRRIGVKSADKVITLTKYDKDSYKKKFDRTNIVHIYNPIDENIFNYVNNYRQDSKKIISVGRLCYQKNFTLLIDIAKEVLTDNQDWSWDIYGEGELRNELEMKIKSYNLEERIQLKGQVDNLYELYNEYSMLVMTSHYEGFPMSLLEGMACGLPLISFDIQTGPNEIITEGENGFLVKPHDSQQMKNKINYLIDNAKTRQEMSKNCKEKCTEYKLSSIIDEWKKLFSEFDLKRNIGVNNGANTF